MQLKLAFLTLCPLVLFSCSTNNQCCNEKLIDLPYLGKLIPKASHEIESSQWGIQV
ncbi:MAG: hypothetical protein KAK04_22465 [Cyclobacteriaceae bacterium]|nr:hypothetical protein [Cyclobacteriaceae bacterium]